MASRSLRINNRITLEPGELSESFLRASGPGGQNVNKVETAVQLRFDVRQSPSLPDAVRARLERLAGRRLTRDGVLVITAQRHRTQERNRQDAHETLVRLIEAAAVPPVNRVATRPTYASKLRNVAAKTRRSATKRQRNVIDPQDRQ